MAPFSALRRVPLVAALSILSWLYTPSYAQTATASLPPTKTYFVDLEGKRLGVKERWAEDANGEKHGLYVRYNDRGLVVNKSTFVHGVQTGAGQTYEYTTIGNQSTLFRKYSGTYRQGQQVGTWTGRNSQGETEEVSVFGEDGRRKTTTFYSGGQPTRIVQHEPAGASTATASRVSPSNFYYYLPAEKIQFQGFTYSTGERQLSGAELIQSGLLHNPEKLAYMVKQNNNVRHIELLLKQCKAMGLNPTKLLMEEPTLHPFTIRALTRLQSAQVDGELLYYGMRGTEREKLVDNTATVDALIRELGIGNTTKFKAAVESHFLACARAAKDAYSDTSAYPLRRWLFEMYANGDAIKWMNYLTEANPQLDRQRYPNLIF